MTLLPFLPRVTLPALLALALAAPGIARSQLGDEVPFITTPDNVTMEMLQAARVGPSDHVIDLGSGDGRIVIVAARRFGATGLGVEIVPELVERSLRSAREAGVADKVTFKVQDLFQTDLSPATVITMYLLPEFNLKLRPVLLALKPGTRIVSHDWDMGDWKPDQTTVVAVPDKKVGLEKSSKVHLWTVPARIDGLWCGSGPLRDFSLRVTQRYQEVEAALIRGDRVRDIQGLMAGTVLRTQSTRHGSLELTQDGSQLRVTGGQGTLAMARGASFARAAGDACR
ncbi:MAG: SAM-dependent methyltransferase [Ramlibacter sp.]|jgi:SAM-dependent methyltransferase